MNRRPLRLTADWAYPVDSPPVRNAALLIGGDGRITAVGSNQAVPIPEGAEAIDCPGAALLPGFVNTHTHLELTGFEASAPEAQFREWILAIRRLKQARRADAFLEAARRGVGDCWAAGITTIADTGDSGAVIQALSELDGSGVVYHEVFGPHPDELEPSMAGLAARVDELRRYAGDRIRLGVSPHAPYTVSGPLYRRSAEYARSEGLPLAVHLAESVGESAFVTRNEGPFAEGWKARGIPLLSDPAHGPTRPLSHPPSPVEWLDGHGVLGSDTLCIHAIQLLPGDFPLLAARRVSIAHCPLSNARHRHGAAPLAELLRAGVRVGLGTDSVASVGTLDMLAEMAEAQRIGGLTNEETLRLATLDGARALGLESGIGSLTPGKWGDVIAVDLSAIQHPAIATSRSPVRLTLLAGRIVHRA